MYARRLSISCRGGALGSTRQLGESAKARGRGHLGEEGTGARDGRNLFGLFVLSAALKVEAGRTRRHFGVRKLRFATPE